jgi:hypothetical protein
MKLLLNGWVSAAVALSLVGQASAQIEVAPSPIHAVPADPAEDQGARISKPSMESSPGQSARAERVLAAITEPPPSPQPILSPQEGAFFVALGRRVTDAAAAYEDYVRSASAIDARFAGADQVQSALNVGEGYNAAQLQEGAIAYAAILALRSEAFVDGVRAQADLGLADRLIADPQQVFGIRGADEAAQDVSGVMQAQAAAVRAAGVALSKAAYSVQRQAWSRGAVAQPQKVLALAKASALNPMAADVGAERRLLDSIGAASQSASAEGGRSEDVTRGLALAAVAILGRAGDAQESRFEPLLRDLRNADCLQMAKMNLNQCLAVAGPQYEDVFCLGQHAVGETAQCLVSAAGARQEPGLRRTAELEDGYGSERAEAYAQAPPPPVRGPSGE